MTEQNEPPKEDIGAEFRSLGDNLLNMLRAAWDRPERQHIQTEIEQGLHELSASLRKASDEFSGSEVGQKVKTGVEDFRTRVETGEVETTLRRDLGKALQTVNSELQKLTDKLRAADKDDEVI